MIRLPPSVLTLGPRDLVEYEERRQQRELEMVKRKFTRFEIGATERPKLPSVSALFVNASEPPELSPATTSDHILASGDGYEEPRYPNFEGPPSSDQSSVRSDIASPENHSQISLEVHRSPSPPKDGFNWDGFIADRTPRRSSPFLPDDISTPQNLPHNGAAARIRTLPRSPLYFSHNASSSPERRPTSSLTPRVASRVANHHTPGLMFSQPARRPATYRHQTNSFSFDSSERSSAAYEQDRISSLSTTDTTPRPAPDLRLHDELLGSSLASSRICSTGGFIFSSPELPLPPPFSTTSRRVSNALPSASPVRNSIELHDSESQSESSTVEHPRTSPVSRSPAMSTYDMMTTDRTRSSTESRRPTPVGLSPGLEESEIRSSSIEHARSSLVGSATTLNDYLRSSAARYVSYYRPPSPSLERVASGPRAHSMRHRHTRTPHVLAVYNDGLPSHTQPQTPAHLPESRHRSRYHPAYTAPVPRGSGVFGGNTEGMPPRYRAPATPSRRSRISPVGLQGEGFRGLYGGRENGDDEQSWVDGVRFSNAEVRLWGLRDAAGDGRTLGDTPEREDRRVGRS